MAQHMAALERAQAIRLERARQRRALIDAPAELVVDAIINPTPELAGIRLSTLLVPDNGHGRGAVPKIGQARLAAIFQELTRDFPHGRHWHEALRLRDLAAHERQRLVDALLRWAPADWASEVAA